MTRLMLAAAAAAALIASPAVAADLPVRTAPIYSPVRAFTWTGFYVGGHLGYAEGRTTLTDPTGSGERRYPTKGFLGGGQVGYNYQMGAWVLGVEADFSGSNADGSTSFVDAATGDFEQATTKLLWTSLITGRVGYAFDRTMIYAKGGVAFGGFNLDVQDFTNGGGASKNVNRTGWTVGAGVEYALTDAWSVRAEYDYLDFTSQNVTLVDNTGTAAALGFRPQVHQARFGLNYRFGSF